MATAASPRRSRWLLIVSCSLAGVLAGAHFLLLGPMSNDLGCARAVHVNHYMAYPLNCDSPEFTKLAQHPHLLLAYDNIRQSRPGYVALGAAVTQIIGSAAARLGLDRAYGEISSAYIPLILINLIVTVAVLATILLARRWRGVALAATLCVMFAFPQVAWVLLCRGISGSYYNQETARYHEFVWLPESVGQGWHALWTRLELASVSSVRELLGADALVLAVLAGCVLAASWVRVRLAAGSAEDSAILVASGLTAGYSLLFGWGIGIIATREMYGLFPAVLVVVGWAATRFALKSRATLLVASYGLALVAIANALHEVMAHGPYS